MSSDNQNLIQKMRRAAHNAGMRLGLARARQKAEQQRAQAALALFLDDLRAEGIDENSPLGLALVAKWLQSRLAKQDEQQLPYDDEYFPRW